MKIYYTARDNGDGSASIEFCESAEVIELLEEHDPEGYGAGEGGGWFEITGEVVNTCYGAFNPTTMEDAKEYLRDMGYLEEDE